MCSIWNEVVAQGHSFPQRTIMDEAEAASFFAKQSYCAVAEEEGTLLGLYILHPNNVGRVGHIANASYAVREAFRGKGVGKALVQDSLSVLPQFGFRMLQFNAVVASNTTALRLYAKLGFERLGTIRGGFALDDGTYEDIVLLIYYVHS